LKGKRGLGWKQKFLMQIAVAAVAAIWIRHGHVAWLGVSVSVFIVLFFSNAYNFADGMDGLAGSILILFAAGLAALGLLELRQDIYMALCAGLIGSVIPFLFLNSPPAKIFMGDVGALPIGAVLGLIVNEMLRPGVRMLPADKLSAYAILPPKQVATFMEAAWPLLILSLVLVAELVPVPLQVASVKLRKKRLFPMTPIHHAFEKAGWPESRVVWMFALVQLLLVALALTVAMNGSGALP
jgi:phospho-N-acetylmuramoyl-pentapeptide-transferase